METDTLFIIYPTLNDTSPVYAVSPDGEGCYWYDTRDEAVEQHGEFTRVRYFDRLTDFEDYRYGVESPF